MYVPFFLEMAAVNKKGMNGGKNLQGTGWSGAWGGFPT